MKNDFKTGDTVRVIDGTKDPDFGIDIGGWHGQVLEIDYHDELVLIELDSITLSEIPDEYFTKCEIDGLDWERIYLNLGEIELSRKRDTQESLVAVRNRIKENHYWDELEASGKIISEALKGIDPEDHLKAFKTWEKYLRERIAFPFDGTISDDQDRSPLHQGDKIKVKKITGYDDPEGVIVKIEHGRKGNNCPLSDIEALDKESPNNQFLNAYRDWFGNR